MTFIESIILGIVEGLAEYLPISSTGHLCLVAQFLGIGRTPQTQAAVNAYTICIQLGAILAVTRLYSKRIKVIAKGVAGFHTEGRKLAKNLLIAFAPAAIVGLALENVIKKHLFGLWPISFAWIAGGLVILAIWKKRSELQSAEVGCNLEDLTFWQAALVGLAQCAALWPGVSRSLATIVGARLAGVSMPDAVEFSFLLGLVTLGTATLYEVIKQGHLVIATFGWFSPLIGVAVAYLSAVVAVRWMVSYINKKGMTGFGYYRLAIGCLVIIGLMINSR